MKALMFLAAGEPLTLQEVPVPSIQPDQLLVRIRSSGSCGTDLHFYRHDDPAKEKRLRYPYILKLLAPFLARGKGCYSKAPPNDPAPGAGRNEDLWKTGKKVRS